MQGETGLVLPIADFDSPSVHPPSSIHPPLLETSLVSSLLNPGPFLTFPFLS